MQKVENKNIGITQEELDKILNKPSPADVVAGILISTSEVETQTRKIPSNTKFLHDFINLKKEEEEYKKILKDFVFSEGTDIYPFSRTLEKSITRLQLGGLLVVHNPRFATLEISPDVVGEAKDRLNEVFNKEERDLLEKLGEQYGEFLEEKAGTSVDG